jgi:hypothetical protein
VTNDQYKALVRKLPRMSRELMEGNTALFLFLAGLGISAFLVTRSGRLWSMILSTTLGSVLSWVGLSFKPFNPFDNLDAKLQGVSPTTIRYDPAAKTLVSLLKSRRAKVYIIKCGLVFSPMLVACVLIIARIEGSVVRSFDLSQDLSWIITYAIAFGFLCIGVECTLLLRWALKQMMYNGSASPQSATPGTTPTG